MSSSITAHYCDICGKVTKHKKLNADAFQEEKAENTGDRVARVINRFGANLILNTYLALSHAVTHKSVFPSPYAIR